MSGGLTYVADGAGAGAVESLEATTLASEVGADAEASHRRRHRQRRRPRLRLRRRRGCRGPSARDERKRQGAKKGEGEARPHRCVVC